MKKIKDELGAIFHEISIEKEGYLSQKDKIIVKTDTVNQYVIDLKPKFAYLEIKSLVQDGEIFINYQSVGKNLFRGERLEPGTYHIEVKHDFYNTYTEELDLKAGDRIFWEIDLTPAIGQLMINTKPHNISLVLQKGEEKKTFLISKKENLPVTAGYYDMELKAASYYPYKDWIKIKGNEITPLDFELKFGGDDLKKLQNQRKWLNLSSMAGLILTAGSLYMANRMYSDYESATKSSDAADYKDLTQTFTYMSYGFSFITCAVSINSLSKWWQIHQLKNQLGLK